jgi:hypothetical protein
MVKKLDLKECEEFAKSKGGLCLSTEYKDNKTKMEWQCANTHIWHAVFNNIKRGKWCPICAGNAKLSLEECQEYAESKGGLCLATEYKNTDTKMEWKCENNHTWYARFDDTKSGTWCPRCAENAKLSLADCEEFAKSKGGLCVSTEYENARTKMKWQCENNHTWNAVFNNIKNGRTWCPRCKNKTESIFSNCLDNEIKELDFIHQAKFDWCKNPETSKHLPFDFCIESKKILIEIDGPQHFEQISNWESPESQKDRDLLKIEKALENGYSILRFLQKDIYENRIDWRYFLKTQLSKIPENGFQIPKLVLLMKGREYKRHFCYSNQFAGFQTECALLNPEDKLRHIRRKVKVPKPSRRS